jgi:hypothetical protein
MFDSLIQAIQAGVTPKELEIDGRSYVTNGGVMLPPNEPTPNPITIQTLTGIVDYLRSNVEAPQDEYSLFLHVKDYDTVRLLTAYHDRAKHRATLIEANCSSIVGGGFSFGTYQPIEAVIIGLQSRFVETEDRNAILEVLGNLKDERVSNFGDDGVSQSVTTRKGIALGEKTVVPRIVTLKPYRTFPEIEQPASQFILRLRQAQRDGEPPTAALFEADGGRWKLDAIKAIGEYLEIHVIRTDGFDLPNVPIIA